MSEQEQALKKARELEKSGKIKEAYQSYLRAGSVQDAARILSTSGRSKDAGRLILGALKIEPSQVASLSSARRKLAYLAATYFAKDNGTIGVAVEIFQALGENSRAADLLERTGDMIGAERVRSSLGGLSKKARPQVSATAIGGSPTNVRAAQRLEKDGKLDLAIKSYTQLKQFGEAGRLLRQQGKPAAAAKMYAEAGMPYEAGICYLEVGDTGKCLDNLVRVPRADDRYRTAVVQAVKVASKLGILNFQLEHFVSEFVESNPVGEKEMETFYLLGELYEKNNLLQNAKEAFTKILDLDPNYRDVSRKMELLGRYTQESAAVYQRIKEQESKFQGDRVRSAPTAREDDGTGLPPLPELPDLPPLPKITGLDLTKGGAPTAVDHKSGKMAMDATMAMYGTEEPAQVRKEEKQSEPDFSPGNIIQNRYRIDSELGRGGMAVVFAARDLELDEDIALKVFLQQVVDQKMQEESLARFKQELKLSRQLNHPNIIRLYDIGLQGGFRYISMELLHGKVLEDLMDGPMDLARGLAYLVQACAGLQVAHDNGVVHRDIKPDNIFITSNETVKVMDFGIAKNTLGQGLTMQGMTAGTPEYIAPEQISSFSEVTGRADQYALGCIAYKMFTGKLAFEHEELTPLLMMHLSKPPTPPREIKPDLPEELEEIILRLLAKKPEDRFLSCKELAGRLQQLRVGLRR